MPSVLKSQVRGVATSGSFPSRVCYLAIRLSATGKSAKTDAEVSTLEKRYRVHFLASETVILLSKPDRVGRSPGE